MDQALVRGLRARGVGVITALDAEMIEKPDQDHLDYATTQGRVLCSFNIRDFRQLHEQYRLRGETHAGIILVPQQRYPLGEQMRRLLKLVATESAESMRDRVEFLSAWTPE